MKISCKNTELEQIDMKFEHKKTDERHIEEFDESVVKNKCGHLEKNKGGEKSENLEDEGSIEDENRHGKVRALISGDGGMSRKALIEAIVNKEMQVVIPDEVNKSIEKQIKGRRFLE